MNPIDQLANGLEAMGCTHPRAHAVLTWEILPGILEEHGMTLGEQLAAQRGERYGHPRDNFRRIGIKWQATLDLPEPIPPELVAIMLLDLKTCRLVQTPGDTDSQDDLEGYAETLRMVVAGNQS